MSNKVFLTLMIVRRIARSLLQQRLKKALTELGRYLAYLSWRSPHFSLRAVPHPQQ